MSEKMRFSVTVNVQFMMKDRERDVPRMLPMVRTTFECVVPIPDDMVSLVRIRSTRTDGESPAYPDVDKALMKKWRQKVNRVFPSSACSDADVIDSMISIVVDEAIDEMIEKDETLVNVDLPVDTDTEYCAGKFVKVIEWKPVV